MPANHSRLRKEYLRQECEERQAVRNKRTPLAQLKELKRRGVPVPAVTGKEVKALEMKEVSKNYCREVVRLVRKIQGKKSEEE